MRGRVCCVWLSGGLIISKCCAMDCSLLRGIGCVIMLLKVLENVEYESKREYLSMEHERADGIELEKYVTDMMLDMGVPAHLKGYRYLRMAIMMAKEDMEVVGSVTKLLYPEIAKKFGTTEQKVERAIRNAIEVSWLRGNEDTFEELFGYSNRTGVEYQNN